MALEKGFYREEGLRVEVAGVFKAGPELLSGFAAGSLDAGYVGLAPALVAAANKTAQLSLIAQVNKNGSALVVRPGSPLMRTADLRGKTVAIPGHATIQDFLLRRLLADAGMEDNQVTIITIKPPEMIPVLTGRQIDAFIAWEPYPSMAVTQGTGRVLTCSRDIWPDHPCCVLAVSTPFMKKRPAEAAALTKAHHRSIAYIGQNPADALSIGIKYTALDAATVSLALQSIHFDEHLDEGQVLDCIAFLNRLGYTSIGDTASFLQSLLAPAP